MIQFKPRSGSTSRTLIIAIATFVLVPILLILVGTTTWQMTAMQQNVINRQSDLLRATQADTVRAATPMYVATAEPQQWTPASPSLLRPEIDTRYEEQIVNVPVTGIDPDSGETVVRPQTVKRLVPVQEQSWVQIKQQGEHDPKVNQLAIELRSMQVGDASREAKMQELQRLLVLEFAKMHENQGKEISGTEERLDLLKKLHQERGLHRDKIVKRRIDELLGMADALQWNPASLGQPVDADSPKNPLLSSNLEAESTIGAIPDSVPPASRSHRDLLRDAKPNVPAQVQPPTNSGSFMNPMAQVNLPEQDVRLPNTADKVLPSQVTVERVESRRSDFTPPAATSRVADSTALIGRLFALARESAISSVELSAAKVELVQVNGLRSRGATTLSELRNVERNVERLTREVEFNSLEFEALANSLRRDRQLTAAAMDRAREAIDFVDAQVRQGVAPADKLLDAKFQLTKAEKEFEDADANLQQLELARKLVGGLRKEELAEPSTDENESTTPAEAGDDSSELSINE